jgi:type IX secretion system PorP/SprF family membrane protein
MKNKKNIAIIGLFLLSVHGNAQDIHFSQFFALPTFVNPANTGLENNLDIGVIHRTQWKALTEPFTSYGVAAATRVGKKRKIGSLGVGLDCFYDKSGDGSYVSMQAGLNVAYHLKITRTSSFSSGLKVNYNQRSINDANFQWGEQYFGKAYDPNLPTGEQLVNLQRINFFDVATGFNYRYKSAEKTISSNDARIIDIGFSAFHINNNNVSLYKNGNSGLGTRAMVYFQGYFGLKNTSLAILPKGYFQFQNKHQEFVAGMLLSYKPKVESVVTGYVVSNAFNFGLLYRGLDAFIGVVQYEMKNYIIGLSYDVNASKLTKVTTGRGAYELSLRFVGLNRITRRSHHSKYGGIRVF